MKLIYKGKFKGYDQLPIGDLPETAVKFNEPDSIEKVMEKALVFSLLAFIPIVVVFLLSIGLHQRVVLNFDLLGFWIWTLISIPALWVHEVLHAIFFGKNSKVEMYTALSKGALFVICTDPISKARFIFLSLFPNIILGLVSLLVWLVLPFFGLNSTGLFVFAVIMLLGGGGDYMNVYNAAMQMPKGSMQQLSGMHSYWFMPGDIKTAPLTKGADN